VATAIDTWEEGMSAAVDPVGERTRRREVVVRTEEDEDSARGRPCTVPAEDVDDVRGVIGRDPGVAASGREMSGGARWDGAPRSEEMIHTVLSAPASARRLVEPALVLVFHAATRTGDVGRAPVTCSSGRKGITRGGSGIGLGPDMMELLLYK
jgi:hypothetical protein